MYIRFAIPQMTFKLSLICDHCKQHYTACLYTHIQIFLWDHYPEEEMLRMICKFQILIDIAKSFPISIFFYLFIA